MATTIITTRQRFHNYGPDDFIQRYTHSSAEYRTHTRLIQMMQLESDAVLLMVQTPPPCLTEIFFSTKEKAKRYPTTLVVNAWHQSGGPLRLGVRGTVDRRRQDMHCPINKTIQTPLSFPPLRPFHNMGTNTLCPRQATKDSVPDKKRGSSDPEENMCRISRSSHIKAIQKGNGHLPSMHEESTRG
jgi:hypothetical protein